MYSKINLFESFNINFIDDFYNLLEKGMKTSGLFTGSSEVEKILNSFEDSIPFRQMKSKIERELNDFINEKFLNRISNLPFDLKYIETYIQIEPKQKENFELGAFYNSEQSLVRIIIKINDIIQNEEDFKKEIYPILLHEMVHVRQVYENKVLVPPVIELGGTDKDFKYWEKKFKEYFMHPSELEAYAIEYNYRNENDPSNIDSFVLNFLKRIGFDDNEKALMVLYKDYIRAFGDYVDKFKWFKN